MHETSKSYTFDKKYIINKYNAYILDFIKEFDSVFEDQPEGQALQILKDKTNDLITNFNIELKELAQILRHDEGFMNLMFDGTNELKGMDKMLISEYNCRFIIEEWVANREKTRTEQFKTIDEHDKP